MKKNHLEMASLFFDLNVYWPLPRCSCDGTHAMTHEGILLKFSVNIDHRRKTNDYILVTFQITEGLWPFIIQASKVKVIWSESKLLIVDTFLLKKGNGTVQHNSKEISDFH